jgi:hypothetical protein
MIVYYVNGRFVYTPTVHVTCTKLGMCIDSKGANVYILIN